MPPIAPLARATALATILELAEPGTLAGVWIDIGARIVPLRVGITGNPRWISLLLSPDLGALLERTDGIILARRARAVLLHRDEVLRIRRVLAEPARAGRGAHARVAERGIPWPVDSPSGASLG